MRNIRACFAFIGRIGRRPGRPSFALGRRYGYPTAGQMSHSQTPVTPPPLQLSDFARTRPTCPSLRLTDSRGAVPKSDMRNTDNVCLECGSQIPPGVPVAIVHTWKVVDSVYFPRKKFWRHTSKRFDHWLCLECVRSKHDFENIVAETGRCENCDREIRHWDFSQPMPSACCAECRRMAANKRSRERRRIGHEPRLCVVCGEMFTPTRGDAKTCSNRCRQKLYRREQSGTSTVRTSGGAA